MADNESIEPKEERELKWKELEMRIKHYRYYLTIALQANAFYYVTTGGVLAFYLKYTLEPESQIPNLEFFLLLPILFGSFLGGIFWYGAGLQKRAIENLDDVRDELRNRLGLSVRRVYDASLLVILLWIFSVTFFLVVSALLILPILLKILTPSEELRLRVPPMNPLNMGVFYVAAVIILIGGFSLPCIACRLEGNLKKQRNTNWWSTILKAEIWLIDQKSEELDISGLEEKNFYHALQPFLDKETLENIAKEDKKFAKMVFTKKIAEFSKKLERKRKREPKMFEENQVIEELKEMKKLKEKLAKQEEELAKQKAKMNKNFRERLNNYQKRKE